jgi:kynurenine formamidase
VEFIDLSDTAKEALWLIQLTRTFQQCNSKWIPTVLSDSQGAVTLAKNPVHHNASKHIEVRYHFIWDCATKEMLSLEKVSTTNNVVDAMTKSLSTDRFRSLRNRMGVELISNEVQR